MKNKKILVIAAHPDDEVLGCGGTIARFNAQGYQVSTLILGEGITSRDNHRNPSLREKEINLLKRSCHRANMFLGVRKVIIYDFPDNRFDTISILDIIKVIEKVKKEIKPDIVYTHHWGDLNIDHKITYEAVMTAFRPLEDETLKEIYSFESPSSTEWSYPNTFMPNVFIDIKDTILAKVKALAVYKTELRKFPHPRSMWAVKAGALKWGSVAGLTYAEAFEAVRIIK